MLALSAVMDTAVLTGSVNGQHTHRYFGFTAVHSSSHWLRPLLPPPLLPLPLPAAANPRLPSSELLHAGRKPRKLVSCCIRGRSAGERDMLLQRQSQWSLQAPAAAATVGASGGGRSQSGMNVCACSLNQCMTAEAQPVPAASGAAGRSPACAHLAVSALVMDERSMRSAVGMPAPLCMTIVAAAAAATQLRASREAPAPLESCPRLLQAIPRVK